MTDAAAIPCRAVAVVVPVPADPVMAPDKGPDRFGPAGAPALRPDAPTLKESECAP